MISRKAKYALHALMALARANSMIIQNIAIQEKIPRKFLEHILLDLKHHGLLESRRGKFGGYAHPCRSHYFWTSASPNRWSNSTVGLLKQDRLSTLCGLSRRELRDQTSFCQSGGVDQACSRSHNDR